MAPPRLTTTSYAILGHLALQPWAMYDLAQQMKRNVHFFYPRAESQVYNEPKKLVLLGLATAATEATGNRPRTIYAITDEGMAALRAWLAEPVTKPVTLEFESLLRVVFAPFGTDEDLRRTIAQVKDDIAGMVEVATRIQGDYLAGSMPFQRHVVHRALLHDFLAQFAVLVDQWADRSLAYIDTWPTLTPDERTAAALTHIEQAGPLAFGRAATAQRGR